MINTGNHKTEKNARPNTLLLVVIICFIAVNLLFLSFLGREAKTVGLLKNELVELERQEKIITSSQELYKTYQNEIEVISGVFPSEETITDFIENLELSLRSITDQYTIKFNSSTPIKDRDSLYLPLTITLKVQLADLAKFLQVLEEMTFMTHVTFMTTKLPDNLEGVGETTVVLKIYVQDPFNNS